MVPSSFEETCVNGAKTKRFFSSTPLRNVTLSNNRLYLLLILQLKRLRHFFTLNIKNKGDQ